jgi:tripartite-type tricarboxylate transporter receptor subunit TctC
VFLPARAPKEITYRLAVLFNDVIKKDGTRDYLANSAGAEAFPGTPESLAKLLASDTEKWGRVIKDAGLYKQN